MIAATTHAEHLANPKEFCVQFVQHVTEEFPQFKGTVVGQTLVLFGIHQQKSFLQFKNSRLAVIALQSAYRGSAGRKQYPKAAGAGSPEVRNRQSERYFGVVLVVC